MFQLSSIKPAGLIAVVEDFEKLVADPESPVRAIRHLPASAGTFRNIPDPVDAQLQAALSRRGIEQLYTHQAEAFDQVEAGRNAVVVTPTASGKTLCYNLPVLNRLLREPEARAGTSMYCDTFCVTRRAGPRERPVSGLHGAVARPCLDHFFPPVGTSSLISRTQMLRKRTGSP